MKSVKNPNIEGIVLLRTHFYMRNYWPLMTDMAGRVATGRFPSRRPTDMYIHIESSNWTSWVLKRGHEVWRAIPSPGEKLREVGENMHGKI